MAATERVFISGPKPDSRIDPRGVSRPGALHQGLLSAPDAPGLRISVRTTTSSFSDYPEWSLASLTGTDRTSVVTDGSCS